MVTGGAYAQDDPSRPSRLVTKPRLANVSRRPKRCWRGEVWSLQCSTGGPTRGSAAALPCWKKRSMEQKARRDVAACFSLRVMYTYAYLQPRYTPSNPFVGLCQLYRHGCVHQTLWMCRWRSIQRTSDGEVEVGILASATFDYPLLHHLLPVTMSSTRHLYRSLLRELRLSVSRVQHRIGLGRALG